MFGTFSFFFLITLVKNGFSLSVDCTHTKNGVSYDVSPLLSRDYKDKFTYYGDSSSSSSSLYWYNIICGNITTTPNVSSCSNNTIRSSFATPLPLGYCPENSITNHTCSSNYTQVSNPVAAYQIENDLCYRLHDGVTKPTINLVNESDPLSGIHIKYINGDFCAANNTNRESNIYILCNNTNANASYTAFESPLCSYVLRISSVFGCPSECINYETNQLCSNHGQCVYNDDDDDNIECNCDEGWSGDLCDNNSTSSGLSTTDGNDRGNNNNNNDDDDDDDNESVE